MVERVIRVEHGGRWCENHRCNDACGAWRRSLDHAWDQFADGCYLDALRQFQSVVSDRPNEGEPRIGYALAAALHDDERSALWSMRQAFEVDPECAAAPRDGKIRDAIECLVDRYERRTERLGHGRRSRECTDPDAFFMLAATAHLSGDCRAALCAIDRAIELGDCSAAARNLREAIRDARA